MNEPVPFVDLVIQYRSIKDEIDAAVAGVLDSAAFILGPEVSAFEREFADYCGVRFGVGVASGSSALTMALLASGIKPGDEVITTPFTFAATAEAITQCGGVIRFVDVAAGTPNLDPKQLDAAIGPATRAVIPVHMYGQPADLAPIIDIARKHQLVVIEDAAQAHGARYRGRRVGSLGDVGCFSFFPSKNLGAFGDGGIVVTNDAGVADRVRLLRSHGQRSKYDHVVEGFGERLDSLQAAILRVKLRHLDAWNESRRRHAAAYRENLEDVAIEIVGQAGADAEYVHHLFVIATERRDHLRSSLEQRGIATGIHYPIPLHLQTAYARLGHEPGDFPNAERLASHVLSLPMYPELTRSQIDRVCEAVASIEPVASRRAS